MAGGENHDFFFAHDTFRTYALRAKKVLISSIPETNTGEAKSSNSSALRFLLNLGHLLLRNRATECSRIFP